MCMCPAKYVYPSKLNVTSINLMIWPCSHSTMWSMWRISSDVCCFWLWRQILGFGKFMLGVWKCHLNTWLCTSIILTYHIWGLMELLWVPLRALESSWLGSGNVIWILGFAQGSFWHIICEVWWRFMWVQMRALEMVGKFMPVLFLIGVWKCHLDTWLCTRIILTFHMWGLVEVIWVQIRAWRWWGHSCQCCSW